MANRHKLITCATGTGKASTVGQPLCRVVFYNRKQRVRRRRKKRKEHINRPTLTKAPATQAPFRAPLLS